jgi:hypothetical protein
MKTTGRNGDSLSDGVREVWEEDGIRIEKNWSGVHVSAPATLGTMGVVIALGRKVLQMRARLAAVEKVLADVPELLEEAEKLRSDADDAAYREMDRERGCTCSDE